MIHVRTILRLLGLLLLLFATAAILPSLLVDIWYHEGLLQPLLQSWAILTAVGGGLWALNYRSLVPLKTADGFVVVVGAWVLLCAAATVPLVLMRSDLSLINAVFEATSGLTTTGAEVLTGLDQLPHAFLFYHQVLQFLGGLGIVVLAMAIMPMLGVGGMQIYRAETVGPIKDNTLTPRITQTAKGLWKIYLALALACMIGYKLCGMNWFEAVSESFSTVSTGGFSIHDQSLMVYSGRGVSLVAMVIMLLSAMNYGVHFVAWQHRSLRLLHKNAELRAFLVIVAIVGFFVLMVLALYSHYQTIDDILLRGIFTSIAMVTTTGLRNANFADWPNFLPTLLMTVALIGGCAGSTSGGIKVMRFMLARREGMRALQNLIHPKAVVSISLGEETMSDSVIQSMRGFIAVFFMLYILLVLTFMVTGVDLYTAFATITACLSNVGVSVGAVAQGYGDLTAIQKSILIFTMLAGRMEVMTLLVLLVPSFWQG